MSYRRRLTALAGVLLAVATMSGCEALKDEEPWTATVTYDLDPTGKLVATPLTIKANSAFGEVQVINDTDKEHGFAVTDHDAAIFEKIPAGKAGAVQVTELRDGLTYEFYCNLHDEDADGREFTGKIVVKFLSEEFR